MVELAIAGDVGSIARLRGSWYHPSGGLAFEIATRPPASLTVRSFPETPPQRAWVENGELYLELSRSAEPITVWFREAGEGAVHLVPPGGSPGWCGTCSPPYRRYAAAWLAHPLWREGDEIAAGVGEAIIDRLAEVF